MKPRKNTVFLLLCGIVLGVTIFGIASASMDVSDSRALCGTCHIMQQASLTQKLSTHANISCNDCHAPSALSAKIIFKAKVGVKDIFANMVGNTEFVTASEETKMIINENCKRCHVGTNQNVASMEAKDTCVSCHVNVPHTRLKEITTREVGNV